MSPRPRITTPFRNPASEAIRESFENMRDILQQSANDGEQVWTGELSNNHSRETVNGAAGLALVALLPRLQELRSRCLASGAEIEGEAMSLGAARYFAPKTKRGDQLLAVVDGDKRYLVAMVEDAVSVDEWFREASPEDAARHAELAGVEPDEEMLAELQEVASRLKGTSLVAYKGSLKDVLDEVAASKDGLGRGRMGSGSIRRGGAMGPDSARIRGQGDHLGLQAFMEVIRPALDALPELPLPFNPQNCFIGRVDEEEELMAAFARDGFLPGGETFRFLHDVVAMDAGYGMADAAQGLPALHAELVEKGYVWGEKRLAYNDTDCRIFAATSPDGKRIGMAYENIDYIDEPKYFFLVGHLREDGSLYRFDVRAFAETISKEVLDENMASDVVWQIARPDGFAEDHALPVPRLNMKDTMQSFMSGEPMPPAEGSLDLVTGMVSEATSSSIRTIIERGCYGVQSARYILDLLRQEPDENVALEDKTDFGDGIDFAAEGDAPSVRM